jgi:hypothetical protein
VFLKERIPGCVSDTREVCEETVDADAQKRFDFSRQITQEIRIRPHSEIRPAEKYSPHGTSSSVTSERRFGEGLVKDQLQSEAGHCRCSDAMQELLALSVLLSPREIPQGHLENVA